MEVSMFEVTTLQEPPTTRRQQNLLDRVKKGHIYMWGLEIGGTQWLKARDQLLWLEECLHDAEFFSCLYPGGLPEQMLEQGGFCIICPVRNGEWSRDKCPAAGKGGRRHEM